MTAFDKILQQQFQRKLSFKLTTLTPVSIGDGGELSYITDFFVQGRGDDQEVVYIDQERLEKSLADHPDREAVIDEYMREIYGELVERRQNSGKQKRRRYDLRRILTKGMDLEIQEFSKYQAKLYASNAQSSRVNIQSIIKSKEQPYISGSTVKGAIKTCVLYHWLLKDELGIKLLEQFILTVNHIYDKVISRITWLINQRDSNFKTKELLKDERSELAINGKKNSPERKEKSDTIKYLCKEINKNRKAITRKIEGDVKQIDQAFEKIITQCFGSLEKDTRNDYSLFKVVDSTPAFQEDTIVCATKRLNLEVYSVDTPNLEESAWAMPVWKECLCEGVELDLTISLERIKNHQIKNNALASIFNEGQQGVTKIVNQFAKDNIAYERQVLEKNDLMGTPRHIADGYDYFLEQLEEKMTKQEGITAFLRLGSGKTYFMNSIGLAIYKKDKGAFKKLRELYDLYPMRKEFPATRILLDDDESPDPLGWVTMRLADVDMPLADADAVLPEEKAKENTVDKIASSPTTEQRVFKLSELDIGKVITVPISVVAVKCKVAIQTDKGTVELDLNKFKRNDPLRTSLSSNMLTMVDIKIEDMDEEGIKRVSYVKK